MPTTDWLWCPCLVPCHICADDVVHYICGRSGICMAMMHLRDLPHTCACTWCCIQRDSGNRIMALLVLRTRELCNLFKLNFTLTMRLTLAILGWPPGRALFNIKSRTLKVLTMVVCCWELNIVTMATPLFFFLFFIVSKIEELTPIRRQDMDWERTYFGALTDLPHTWSLQNFKCMEFKFPSVVVPSSRHIEGL